jgi:hypothetical protein
MQRLICVYSTINGCTSALIELELGEKIKSYGSGSYCPLSWGLLDNHGALQPIPDYYLLDTSVEMADCISQEIESDPQVLDLFAQLEPGTLLLNTYEYSLSPPSSPPLSSRQK